MAGNYGKAKKSTKSRTAKNKELRKDKERSKEKTKKMERMERVSRSKPGSGRNSKKRMRTVSKRNDKKKK